MAMWIAAIPLTILCKLTMSLRPFSKPRKLIVANKSNSPRAASAGSNSSSGGLTLFTEADQTSGNASNSTSSPTFIVVPWPQQQWQSFVMIIATVLEHECAAI